MPLLFTETQSFLPDHVLRSDPALLAAAELRLLQAPARWKRPNLPGHSGFGGSSMPGSSAQNHRILSHQTEETHMQSQCRPVRQPCVIWAFTTHFKPHDEHVTNGKEIIG